LDKEKHLECLIPKGYFDEVKEGKAKDDRLIEILARYGDPTMIEMPSIM
tara:strand:- start:149 stop:295 length:147 start_codon:yes stop_codon:yes gene_type:complete